MRIAITLCILGLAQVLLVVDLKKMPSFILLLFPHFYSKGVFIPIGVSELFGQQIKHFDLCK